MSEMATGFIYCTVLASVLAVAAHWAESALRGVGRAGRWPWFVAMVLALAVPLMGWLGWRAWTARLPVLPSAGVFVLPEVAGGGAAGGGGMDWTAVVQGVWALASLVLLMHLVVGIGRLRAAMRGWRQERVEGVDVLVTENVGPAVFGLHRASILMPSWALTIHGDLRALMLLHEREHMRAGDPWLLASALVMVVLVPWNPVVWYQLHRLRLAVEMDCDARVLRRVPDPQRYGRLLLEVGRRRSGPLAVLALSEPVTFLERRIRAFTRRAGPYAVRRALALGAGAFCLGALAVCARDPISPEPVFVAEAVQKEAAVPGDPSRAPIFTPYTVKPALRNPAQVAAALQKTYPPLLRDAGIGGTTTMWFYINEQGRVVKTQVFQSSGYDALDDAAMRVAELMQFSPALNRDQPAPVWVQIPITFKGLEADESALPPRADGATYSSGQVPATAPGDGPYFTPYTRKPALENGSEVSKALQQNFPPLVRDAGIGGTTTLWFHITEKGDVDDIRVNTPSGYPALDEAAQRVARMMRFSPALNRDQPVAVWVQIPITFSSK